MLRPATPLTILYLIAFVLLLLSTISVPIVKAIPLATHEGVSYGVFGACKGNQCTPIQVGYPQRPFGTDEDGDFTLSPDSRHALSNILIVHPIAAFLTLVCTILAFASHFHSPAHSPRYLLALLILSFPTLLVTLLAFLVDILLFVPHMNWGGWIVLAATLLIVASGIVTCAMRRTLVSRKARKKRIAENSEMNGDNYYANRDMPRLASDHVGLPRADSPPPMHDPKVPQFATFENSSEQRKTSDDDRQPLNPRTPSVRSVSTNGTRRVPLAGGPDAPPMPGYENGPIGAMQNRDPQRDQYGNPPPEQYGGPLPPNVVAMGAGLPPPGLRHHRSRGSMNSEGSNRSYQSNGSRGAPPGYRGRGGGPGPQRGGYPGPQRGGFVPGPRGGYGPPPRGGMNQGPYRGGPQGGPRGGPQGMIGGPGPRGGGMIMNRNPSNPAPPDHDIDNYYGSIPDAMPPAVAMGSAVPRTQSPAPQPQEPVGQAIEMDERNGIASPPLQSQNGFGHIDRDGDVAGMVALQQARHSPGPGLLRPGPERSTTPSASSQYSNDRRSEQPPTVYAPPRLNWNPNPSPQANPAAHPAHRRTNSDHYYEDVDPRFASDEPLPTIAAAAPPSPVPSALRPGANLNRFNSPQHLHPHSHDFGPSTHSSSEPSLPRAADSYENIPEGARSPAGSDASHFTSISQRGVNPNWRPMGGPMGPGPMHHGPMGPGGPGGPGPMGPPRQQGPRRDEMILGANPDFALPGMRMAQPTRGRGVPMRGGMRGAPGGMAMGPPMGVGPNGMGMEGSGGMSGNGRYPTDI